jgi:hypothetical protein
MGVLISPIKPGESVVAARPVPKTVVTLILSSYVDVVGNSDVGDTVDGNNVGEVGNCVDGSKVCDDVGDLDVDDLDVGDFVELPDEPTHCPKVKL